MNARSALETGFVLVLGAIFGAAICWLWVGKNIASEANISAAANIAAIESAAPAIALQVQSLQQTAITARRLNGELANNAQAIRSLADCPLPDGLHGLSIQRTDAINASAEAAASKADLPERGGD
jgi:hypothetical protein